MTVSNGLLAKVLHFSRFCWPAAPGRLPDDAIVEQLRAGLAPCSDAFRSEQALAMILNAAARPGTERELSGEAAAIDAFILATIPLHTRVEKQTRRRPHARGTPVLVSAISTAIVAGLYGTALADALPAPLQQFTHSAFGAPAPGRPAGASTGSSGSGSRSPGLGVNASRRATSTSGTGQVSGQNTGQTSGQKAKSTPGHSGKAHSSNKGSNGNGKAKGKTESNGNGNGNGKAKNKGAVGPPVASTPQPPAPLHAHKPQRRRQSRP